MAARLAIFLIQQYSSLRSWQALLIRTPYCRRGRPSNRTIGLTLTVIPEDQRRDVSQLLIAKRGTISQITAVAFSLRTRVAFLSQLIKNYRPEFVGPFLV
jgi:hypothetical protein